MSKPKLELCFALVMIGMSMFILFSDNLVEGGIETDLGSLFLPRVVAVIMVFLSVMIARTSLNSIIVQRKTQHHEVIDLEGFSGVFLYIFTMVAYWLALSYFGFVLSTLAAMLFVAYIFGARGVKAWIKVVLMSAVVTFGVDYGAKEFLRVYLPPFNLF